MNTVAHERERDEPPISALTYLESLICICSEVIHYQLLLLKSVSDIATAHHSRFQPSRMRNRGRWNQGVGPRKRGNEP